MKHHPHLKQLFNTFLGIFIAAVSLNNEVLYAQQSTCVNADFEQNSFAGWIGHTGERPTGGCCPIVCPNLGIVTGRHTIMTGTGTDANTGGLLPVVAPGGLFSVRLGNDDIDAEAEQISYSFLVTPQTQMFIYRYAVVLEDFGHADTVQPRFEIRVFDQNGAIDSMCGLYSVAATSGLTGFNDAVDPYDTASIIRWKDWTTVGIDLSAKLGSTITIEFSTGDCGLGGHFGYAYIDCMCYPFNVMSDFCAGAVNATLTAPPGFAAYLWNTGETTQSILVNNPTIGDTFTVVLTSVTGCQVVLNSIIRQTIVATAYSLSDSCYNAAFFIDSSYLIQGSPINQWNWDFGDGTTSTVQHPNHAYLAPGNYNVTLVITNQGGCKDTISHLITTIGAPISGFTYTPVCPGNPAPFTDTSSSPNSNLIGWQWDFGDGSIINTNQNTVHTYALQGTYPVTLVVEDNNNCRDTAQLNYATTPAPIAAFTDSITCTNNKVFFKDVSLNSAGTIISQTWNFGDNTPIVSGSAPVHSYATSGTYLVTLTITSSTGCIDTAQKTITLLTPPVANFAAISACAGQPVSFTDQTIPMPVAITSWQWNFGDGSAFDNNQNPVHVYTHDSSNVVTLIVTAVNGCIDSVHYTIFVPPLPVPAFSAVNPVCVGNQVQFANTSYSAGGSPLYQWNFGDGSPTQAGAGLTHIYNASGNYPVTLTVTSLAGCIDSMKQNIFINPLPAAVYTANNVCFQQPVIFQDYSTVAGGTITGWNWNFGDGAPIDSNQNTLHIYQTPASFITSFTVTSNHGCTSTVSSVITIYSLPVANMNITTVCLGEMQNFSDASDSGSAHLTNWFWNFGDASSIVNTQNALHMYADSGFYTVQLVVVNANYCYDTIQQPVYVKPLPEADFITTVLCKDSAVSFTDQSSLASGNITNWWWDFGDGGTSTIQHPVHTYADAGTMNVQLIVTGNNTCQDTLYKPLDVNPLPVPDFSYSNICVYEGLVIHDYSTLINGFITHWQWNFGDGNTDTVQNPVHHYNNSGNYNIYLATTGNNGCRNDTLFVATVNPQPLAVFTSGPACENNLVSFDDHSTVPSGNLVHWIWNMNDGSSLINTQNVQHIFQSDSIFMITMMVFSDSGCIDTSQQLITIHPKPGAGFSADTVCYGLTTAFINHSIVASGLIQQYHWYFGNNSFSNLINPAYSFYSDGIYPVQLTVVTDFGCVDSVKQDVKVYALPQPDFIADVTAGCQPLTVKFQDLSTSQEGSINHWRWNFGDGNTNTDSMPGHLFPDEGVFDVSLIVTTDLNCIDSIIKPAYINVYPKPEAGFYYSPDHPNQLFPLIQFNDQSSGADFWLYSFGDADSSVNSDPTHIYSAQGNYNVMQIVTTDFGCKDTAYRIIEIENAFTLYIPNAFTPNHDGRNDFFTAAGMGITGFSMSIFNRWGQLLFTSSAMEDAWNGMHNGNPVPQDVYFYIVKVTDIFDESHTINGRVTVVY